eukprot:5380100-Amphidinium_carterae.1
MSFPRVALHLALRRQLQFSKAPSLLDSYKQDLGERIAEKITRRLVLNPAWHKEEQQFHGLGYWDFVGLSSNAGSRVETVHNAVHGS